MQIFKAAHLKELPAFSKRQDQLALLERQAPQQSKAFFQKLMQARFNMTGKVGKETAESDIKNLLQKNISQDLQSDSFYDRWVTDMAEVCKVFCETQDEDTVGFWLRSERGCRRYHIDNVPLRALVTYAGKGTEYLPDEAADRQAFLNGAPNENIVKDPLAIRFMNAWDVAVFRGGSKGLLHRTPDAALNGPSILMRLDHTSFWDNILKQNANAHLKNSECIRQ